MDELRREPLDLFFQEMRRFGNLTREDEAALGKPIKARQELEEWAEQTCQARAVDGVPGVLTDDEKKRLDLSRKLSKPAEDKLTKHNLRLVVKVARRHLGRGLSLWDLIQEGNIGLMRAAEKFDYTLGYLFHTYAVWWIRQGMRRGLADHGSTIRRPVHRVEDIRKMHAILTRFAAAGVEPTDEEMAVAMEVSVEQYRIIVEASFTVSSLEHPIGGEDDELTIGDMVEAPEEERPDHVFETQDLQAKVRELLKCLTPKQAYVLIRRRGLYGFEVETLEELGVHFGVTRERIRQIEEKAIERIKKLQRAQLIKLTGKEPVLKETSQARAAAKAKATKREQRLARQAEAASQEVGKLKSLAPNAVARAPFPVATKAPRNGSKIEPTADDLAWLLGVTGDELVVAIKLRINPPADVQIPTPQVVHSRFAGLKPVEAYVLASILGLNGRKACSGMDLARQHAMARMNISAIFMRAKKLLLQ